ncbi:MAG: hypothetical protein RSA40_02990 [Malacoplasma sp.]
MKLIIDGVLQNLDIAILDKDNKVIYSDRTKQNKNLSEILVNKVEESFVKSNTKINDIKDIYIVNGPGSFTSLKLISIFANTWKQEKNINLFTINTCLWNSRHDNSILWFDAKSDKIFYSKINSENENLVEICDKKWFENNIKILDNVYELDEEQDIKTKITSQINNFKSVNIIVPNYIKEAL